MKTCRIEGCPKSPGKGKNGYCYMHNSRIRKGKGAGSVEQIRLLGGSAAEKLLFYGWTVSNSGCWLWNGSLSHGYGQVMVAGRQALTHRLSYEAWVGPIPDGLFVCHRCDTPRCMNPDHLFLGTLVENLQDMVTKGRQSRGHNHYNTALDDEDVLAMRRLRADGVPVSELIERFGVKKRQVYRIINGEQWKHLPTVPATT